MEHQHNGIPDAFAYKYPGSYVALGVYFFYSVCVVYFKKKS